MKQQVVGHLQTVRVQDLTVVVLCALFVYLLRVRDIHTLTPHWRQDFNTSLYANRLFPGRDEHLPPPVVTDLESDGIAEVVVISNDLKLQVLVIPAENSSRVLPLVTVKSQTYIPIDIDSNDRKNYPIVMETGYLDRYQSAVQVRKQVIIVVMDNWRVFCFDSDLEILWEQKLMNTSKYDDHYRIKSMSALVTAEALKRSDRGSVIIGGAFAHKAHEQVPLYGEQETASLNPGRMHASFTGSAAEEDVERGSRSHFSTFCLSGDDGSVRWHHLPGDFEAKPVKTRRDAHHWKLALHWNHHHEGEENWARYSDELLKQLPYSWSNIRDTRLDLARFRKNMDPTVASVKSDKQEGGDLFGLRGEHVVGYAYGGMRPHSRHEHIQNPNAVVVRHHKGIEVLALATGRPFTMLHFQEEKANFADVNNDGNLDRVKIDFSDENCQVEVTTLQPAISVWFTGPLDSSASWWSALNGMSFFSEPAVSEDTHVQIPPVLAKSVSVSAHPLHHLLGYNRGRALKGYDVIGITSNGRVTSYSPLGEMNWQTLSPAKWSDIAGMNQAGGMRSSEANMLYETSFFPSLTPFSEVIYAPKDSLLAVGWDSMAVLDLRDGSVLSHHTLPCQTVAPPVIADFNNDGQNDFIITCPLGYIGFVNTHQPNYIYMGVLAVAVMLALLSVTWCLKSERSFEENWYDYD